MATGYPSCADWYRLWAALGCAHFHADDPRRQAWTGKWPGEEDCERLDCMVNDDPMFPI